MNYSHTLFWKKLECCTQWKRLNKKANFCETLSVNRWLKSIGMWSVSKAFLTITNAAVRNSFWQNVSQIDFINKAIHSKVSKPLRNSYNLLRIKKFELKKSSMFFRIYSIILQNTDKIAI